MQFLGQCLDLDEYVRKSPKKNFFVHSAINKMREEHKVFSSSGSEYSFGDPGFFASLCCFRLRRFNGACLFIASAIALTN